ncbi:MAG: hypothetical protein IPH93_06390 [Saprospiraceae bacterium]|nr:hypothetical protein [Saprospiraceae bacterium]MBK9631018.1 hypothetical protein [Saprospiraceae bacterium]
MNPILRNILAVIAGLVSGNILIMLIHKVSGSIIPPPDGADITTMEGLKSSMQLFEPKHFLMPFLAHALGTFLGAAVTAYLAASNHFKLAMLIGVFFLVAGIINVVMLPSPIWFSALDILVAYLPMAYLGGKLTIKNN